MSDFHKTNQITISIGRSARKLEEAMAQNWPMSHKSLRRLRYALKRMEAVLDAEELRRKMASQDERERNEGPEA